MVDYDSLCSEKLHFFFTNGFMAGYIGAAVDHEKRERIPEGRAALV